jgi:hypothetical protein
MLTTNKLPAALVAAETAIVDTIADWYGRAMERVGDGRHQMKQNLIGQLQRGEHAAVPLPYILAMANAGHEPAQWALRDYIRDFIDQHRFNDLPVSLQHYNMKVLQERALPGYGRGHKIVDTWSRDVVIAFSVKTAMERWSLKKKPAAGFVALAVQRHGVRLKTRQVLDIYGNRESLGARLVAFLLAEVPDLGTD